MSTNSTGTNINVSEQRKLKLHTNGETNKQGLEKENK